MPSKVKLVEIRWDDAGRSSKVPDGKVIKAQFNPETLKVSYQNQNRAPDAAAGGSQFVGSGTTKMSIELLFDTTESGADVRDNTRQVMYFMTPKPAAPAAPDADRAPPGVRVEWGSFLFDGVVESIEESLEYFSEEGVPLRALLALSMTRPQLEFLAAARPAGGAGSAGSAGITPTAAARAGETLQSLAARVAGGAGRWKEIAAANNIDDPLRLNVGARINVAANAAGSVAGTIARSF